MSLTSAHFKPPPWAALGPSELPIDPALVPAHTTVAAGSVAHWVAQHHGLAVRQGHLIRRGLNDTYALRAADGQRYVARLYALRPRGAFNTHFEVSLLQHLHAHGVGVAEPVLTACGRTHALVQMPEGARALVVFRFVAGAVPDTPHEFELTGRTLAHIHMAAHDYAGPPSLYVLDGQHLAGRTQRDLEAHPDLDPPVVATYRALVQRLLGELAAVADTLTRVSCHGDAHGFNNHIITNAAGLQEAVFFDFDDAGPGFLAYDLCVLPWSYLHRKSLTAPDDTLRERWAHYLRGYQQAGGTVSDADLAALSLFVQLRHLWNLGEAAGRHHWGTDMVTPAWLKQQVDVMAAWAKVDWQV